MHEYLNNGCELECKGPKTHVTRGLPIDWFNMVCLIWCLQSKQNILSDECVRVLAHLKRVTMGLQWHHIFRHNLVPFAIFFILLHHQIKASGLTPTTPRPQVSEHISCYAICGLFGENQDVKINIVIESMLQLTFKLINSAHQSPCF